MQQFLMISTYNLLNSSRWYAAAHEISNESKEFGRKETACMQEADVLKPDTLFNWCWHWQHAVFALS